MRAVEAKAGLRRPRDLSLAACLARLAAAAPDRIAVLDGTRVVTRAELADRAASLGAAIVAAEFPSGPIGVLLPDGADFIVAMFGLLRAGRLHLLLDRRAPPAFLASVVASTGLAGVLVQAGDAPMAAALGLPVIVYEDCVATGQPTVPATVDLDAPAVILLTSGSTGVPKGIVHSQRSLMAPVPHKVELTGLGEGDVLLSIAPGHTAAAYLLRVEALLAGAALLLSDLRSAGHGGVLTDIARARVTILRAPPQVMKALLSANGAARAIAGLRFVHLGGDVLFRDDVDAVAAALPPACRIYATLSSTEARIADWVVDPAFDDDPVLVASGVPLPGSTVTLLGEDGCPVPDGEPGAVVVRGHAVAIGEWIDGRLVAGRLHMDPDDPSRRMVRTGDIARRTPSGRLVVAGREDRIVKIHGQRVDPGLIEAAMRRLPDVAEAAILVRQADGRPASLVGFVVPVPGRDAVAEAVARGLRASLPAAHLPARVIEVAGLPLNPSGKIDREALTRLAAASQSSTAGSQARSPEASPASVRAVAIAWLRVFGAPPAPGVSFVDSAGDSLRLLTFVFALESRVGRSLSLDAFRGDADAAGMARALDQALVGHRPAGSGIFMLAGARGDTPGLAGLRAECLGAGRMDMLAYPGWREMLQGRMGMDGIVAAALADIRSIAAEGPLTLVGYSFGVHVAAAAAFALEAEGRRIDRLIVIDMRTPRWSTGRKHVLELPGSIKETWWSLHRLRRPGVRQEMSGMALARLLGSAPLRPLARRIGAPIVRQLERLPGDIGYWTGHHLAHELRFQATSAWASGWSPPARTLRAPVLVIRTTDHPAGTPADLGWGELAEHVEVVAVGGDHMSVLSAAHRAAVSGAIRRALMEPAA